MTATVEGVDQRKSTLKLRAADGDRLEFKVPKGLLASLQEGDRVQLGIQKVPGTPERSPTSGTARPHRSSRSNPPLGCLREAAPTGAAACAFARADQRVRPATDATPSSPAPSPTVPDPGATLQSSLLSLSRSASSGQHDPPWRARPRSHSLARDSGPSIGRASLRMTGGKVLPRGDGMHQGIRAHGRVARQGKDYSQNYKTTRPCKAYMSCG
jgi:hypothetical protein